MVGGVVGICNVAGAITGIFLALRYGSGFIRVFFLILLLFLIVRMGISIFYSGTISGLSDSSSP